MTTQTFPLQGDATFKQLSFLNTLVAERDPENLNVVITKALLQNHTDGKVILTKKQASNCIGELLKLPKMEKAPVASFPEDHDFTGIYLDPEKAQFSGKYIVVAKTKTGGHTAKAVLKSYNTANGVSLSKTSSYATVKKIKDGLLVKCTEAQIADLGKKYGICYCCGRTLTDPESIANGLGPICAAKYF